MFWVLMVLFVAFNAITAIMARRGTSVQPSALGDFSVPTADEARVIPVIWGTVKLCAPNVVWYGDLKISPIKSGGGLFHTFGLSGIPGLNDFGKSTIGYKYSLGMQLALCHGPVDAFVEMRAGTHPDDKTVPASLSGHGTGWRLDIDQPNLFGGEKAGQEGGLKGLVDLYKGDQLQASDDYISAHVVNPAPAYRGLCYAVARQVYCGTTQYIKNWSFVLRRCPDPLGLGAHANIAGDANPANMLFETLINQVWGLGKPSQSIDADSFRACGEALYAEGMGLSMQMDNPASADTFMGDVLRHIDGAIYTDPSTGLWTMRLARFDYNPDDLLELTPLDVVDVEISRGSWEETLNQVVVTYTDRVQNFKVRPMKADESANFATRGELASDTIPFKGFSNATVALKVAMRELKTHSYPLAQLKVTVNRKAWNLRIASVFKLSWPPLGIEHQVFRVTQIHYGAMEEQRIEIEACEDIFAVAYAAFDDPGSTGWIDPVNDPTAPLAQLLMEAPYHMVGDERRVLTCAVRANSLDEGYELWTDEGTGYYETAIVGGFASSGVLAANYARSTAALDTVGFLVSGGRDLEQVGATDAAGRARGTILALVDSEILSVTAVSDNQDGTWTVSGVLRGALDTLPADHAVGARVWFFLSGFGYVYDEPLGADRSITCKALPFNPRGTVDISQVSGIPITTASRAAKPYPPANVKVNTLPWPATTVHNATLTWEHRNRVSQRAANLVPQQDQAGLGYSPEGTYKVEVLVGGTLKQTYSGLTGTSQAYTALQRFLDDKDGSKTVQLRITRVNGSLSGNARTTDAFRMSGFGLAFGLDFGGMNG